MAVFISFVYLPSNQYRCYTCIELGILFTNELRKRKAVFGVSDKDPHKLGCTANEDDQRLQILELGSRGFVLSMKRKQRH